MSDSKHSANHAPLALFRAWAALGDRVDFEAGSHGPYLFLIQTVLSTLRVGLERSL